MPTPIPSLQPESESALVEALRSRGQRVTSQRLIVYRVLSASGAHLSADELGRRASDVLPGLSVPTVYATLELLCELGFARRIETGGTAIFEAASTPHHHLRCAICGSLQDVTAELATQALTQAAARADFHIDQISVMATGRCSSCRLSLKDPPLEKKW